MLHEVRRRPVWSIGLCVGLVIGWSLLEVRYGSHIALLPLWLRCAASFLIGLSISLVWRISPKWKH